MSAHEPQPEGWTDVNTREAARLIGISYYALRDRVTARKVACQRYGYRGVRFTWAQIQDFKAMHEQRASAPADPAGKALPVDPARVRRAVQRLGDRTAA